MHNHKNIAHWDGRCFKVWRALFPRGTHREYLIWLALRWDEFVTRAYQINCPNLIEGPQRYQWFSYWLADTHSLELNNG